MGWSFLTNHARVLLYVARHPDCRLRDIALFTDITERAVHRIVSDLVEDGYLSRHRVGRRNSYEVHPERPLRQPEFRNVAVGDFLSVLLEREPA